MNPLFYLRSLQNSFSFALRSALTWERIPSLEDFNQERDRRLQSELKDFLDLLDWSYLPQKREIRVADIGARDFVFAPVFETHFRNLNYLPEIHGVEIDAYRRYTSLLSRADFGRYHAAGLSRGFYHCCDFLDWNNPLDVCFFLHPFVTPEPPLRWGLPLSAFKPQELFNHASDLLEASGLLIVSNPTREEQDISVRLALKAGFEVKEYQTWWPDVTTAHRKPRFGTVFGNQSAERKSDISPRPTTHRRSPS